MSVGCFGGICSICSCSRRPNNPDSEDDRIPQTISDSQHPFEELNQGSSPVLPQLETLEQAAQFQLKITNVKNEENRVNLIEALNGDVLPLILEKLSSRSIYDFSESLGLIDDNIRSEAITVFSNELIKSVNDATDAEKEAAFEENLSQVPDELIFGVIDTFLIELANNNKDNLKRNKTLAAIAKQFAQNYPDRVDKSVEIANKIDDIHTKNRTLEAIAKQFAQNYPDRVDKSVEIANKIDDIHTKNRTLEAIAKQFAQNYPDRVDESVEIVNKIDDIHIKNRRLEAIAKQFAQNYPDRVDKSVEIANKIDDIHTKNRTLEAIAKQFAQNYPDRVDESVEIVNKIDDIHKESQVRSDCQTIRSKLS